MNGLAQVFLFLFFLNHLLTLLPFFFLFFSPNQQIALRPIRSWLGAGWAGENRTGHTDGHGTDNMKIIFLYSFPLPTAWPRRASSSPPTTLKPHHIHWHALYLPPNLTCHINFRPFLNLGPDLYRKLLCFTQYFLGVRLEIANWALAALLPDVSVQENSCPYPKVLINPFVEPSA